MARDRERQKVSQKRHRDRLFEKLAQYLKENPCVDCSEGDLRVLQFDHLPQFEKKFDIGRSVTGSTRSWESIESEMLKCEVVCANCHQKRTGARSGWRKHLLEVGTYTSPEGLYDKTRKFRVEHGGGVKGRRDCGCNPCRTKKLEYDRNWSQNSRKVPKESILESELKEPSIL
jgi:hypothetical protein